VTLNTFEVLRSANYSNSEQKVPIIPVDKSPHSVPEVHFCLLLPQAAHACLMAEITAAPWASLSGNDGGADQERDAGIDGACSSTVNEDCRDRQLFTASDRGTLSGPTCNLDVRGECPRKCLRLLPPEALYLFAMTAVGLPVLTSPHFIETEVKALVEMQYQRLRVYLAGKPAI
jgi:hypothetical protein